MSEALTGILQQAASQAFGDQAAKTGANINPNGKSFETILRQQDGAGGQIKIETDSAVKDQLEQLQRDLIQRKESSSLTKADPGKIPAELLDAKSRMGLLREASRSLSSSPSASGFEGKFVQIEKEYKQVEAIMASDNNLSPGELLALQARLYQVSQHIEVMSKVVDQMSGGIKTVLNTNV